MIIVIGRGHSGTRIIPQILRANGVFMGGKHCKERGDLVPGHPIYNCAGLAGMQIKALSCFEWNFTRLFDKPPDLFYKFMKKYLKPLQGHSEPKGWKLPENTLIFPWLVQAFPDAYFIYMVRDPRDVILGHHYTDNLDKFNIPVCNTQNRYRQRAISCKYQNDIVKATPKPKRFLKIRFEDIVTNPQYETARLSEFLKLKLTCNVEMDTSNIEKWKRANVFTKFHFLAKVCVEHNYKW